jgi:hypothetical protein
MTESHNAWAGQGSVMLDIGGDVGALVVTMPASMDGVEVELRPEGAHQHHDHDHSHSDGHDQHGHLPHVAVVPRPVEGGLVPSLVFPELAAGGYELYEKGHPHDVRLVVEVEGGRVTTSTWPG